MKTSEPASTSAPAEVAPRELARPTPDQVALGGLPNQVIQRYARAGSSLAGFPGAPMSNQDTQRYYRDRGARPAPPTGCPTCAARAARFGVQAKCADCTTRAKATCDACGDQPAASAKPALDGAAQPLPHFDRIQASFGRHDLSAVRTLTGGAARGANDALGARAYTAGGRIGFREMPDAWLAAHESAHVIQQRDGTHVPGGGAGDPWEHHADQVADAVVSGRSAEPLLDRVAGRGGAASAPQVQLKPAGDAKTGDAKTGDAKTGDAKTGDAKTGEPASGWVLTYHGVELSDSPSQLRKTLEPWAAKQGDPHGALRELARDYSNEAGVHDNTDVVAGATELGGICAAPDVEKASAGPHTSERLAKVLNAVVLEIISDDVEYLSTFEQRAIEITNGLLDESQARVTSELEHYGVRDVHLEAWGFRVAGTIDDNMTTRGMGLAAEGLLARKKRLDVAEGKFREKRSEVTEQAYGPGDKFDRYRHVPSYVVKAIAQGTPGYREAEKEHADAERDFKVYKQQVQQMYPVLASWTDERVDEDSLKTLQQLKSGKSSSAASLIISELGNKLVNIDKVRHDLKPGGAVNIWRVPKIVAGTRQQLSAPEGSLKEKILDKKIADEQPSVLSQFLVGLLQFALVLAAPVTEGASLIPAAALSAGQAYQQFKEYELQDELSNTDFGAAALSAGSPSLFWLAASIVAAGFDVAAAGGAAFKIFGQLGPAARAIRAGESADVAATHLAELERAAADAGGETLAKKVIADAKAIQQAEQGAGMTAEEAAAFERVGEEAADDALKSGAQEATNVAGGKTKVSVAGDLWSCRSPCEMMSERYRGLLEREPAYAARIKDLEQRARALEAGDDAGRKAIAQEAGALEREMRTTVQPGEWSSPLQGSAKYDDLVARRGSALPALDGHPPNWSGQDEAHFLYGTTADDLPKGYQFVLQEDGSLAVRRLDATSGLPPLHINPTTGAFEAVEEGVVRAEADAATRQSKAFGELGETTRTEMNDLLAKRKGLIARRDELEALKESGKISGPQSEELSKLYAAINDKSRLLGEAAADELYKNAERVYPTTAKGSTSGDFDRVYKVGDEYHVVEAKGGGSGLGTRNVDGQVVQQGTAQYLDDIIANMKKNPATKQVAVELEAARQAGKVKYVLVRAPIGASSGEAAVNSVYKVDFAL